MSFDDLARRMGAPSEPMTAEQLAAFGAPTGSRTTYLVFGWLLVLFGIAAVALGIFATYLNPDLQIVRFFLVPFGIGLGAHGAKTCAQAPPKSPTRSI